MDYQIDSLDQRILQFLLQDSRTPFLEIARELGVAGGTIHARVNRMREAGVIQGSRINVDYAALGFQVGAFVGVGLGRAGSCQSVVDLLSKIPEVVEIHYTTGSYALLIKLQVRTIQDLYRVVSEQLQTIQEIQSTETFVILNTPICRQVPLEPDQDTPTEVA